MSAAFETLKVASVEIIESISGIFLPDRMKQGTSTNVVLKITYFFLRVCFGYFRLGNQSVFDQIVQR